MSKSFLVGIDACVTDSKNCLIPLRENAAHLSLKITTIVQFLVHLGTSNIHFKGLQIDGKLTSTDVHCYGLVKADAIRQRFYLFEKMS